MTYSQRVLNKEYEIVENELSIGIIGFGQWEEIKEMIKDIIFDKTEDGYFLNGNYDVIELKDGWLIKGLGFGSRPKTYVLHEVPKPFGILLTGQYFRNVNTNLRGDEYNGYSVSELHGEYGLPVELF